MNLTSLKKLAMVCIVAATSTALAKKDKGAGNGELLAQKAAGGISITNINQVAIPPSLSIPMVGDLTILPSGVIPSYYSPKGYADLQARCSSALGYIGQARFEAVKEFNRGNVNGAAKALIDGLEAASEELAAQGAYGPRANPAIVMAVRHGAAMAKFAAKDTEVFANVLQENTPYLKLHLVNAIVKLVEKTFKQLDVPYFFTSIGANGHCSGQGCYNGMSRDLPVFNPAYFGATADVASKFIGIYMKKQGMMATNLLRLSIAAQASWSAAEILNTSPFRYDYSCAVTRLDYINKGILKDVKEYFKMPGSTPAQRTYKERFLDVTTSWANQEMEWAFNQVNLQSCNIKKSLASNGPNHGGHNGHGFQSGGGNEADVDVDVTVVGNGNDVKVEIDLEQDED